MTSIDDLKFRVASHYDYDAILQGLKEYYWPDEPLSSSFKDKKHSKSEEDFVMKLLDYGVSLIAETSDDKNTCVGFILCAPYSRERAKKLKESILATGEERFITLLTALGTVMKQFDMLKEKNVEEVFQIFAVAVAPDWRQKSIATKLFEKAFELANEKGIHIVYVISTDAYTAKISEKLNMECVASLTYADHKNENDIQIFNPLEPHITAKGYVKKL